MLEFDDDFVDSLRRRDARAYDMLVRRFETPLYRYFMAAHGNPQLASEQSADCFSRLVEAMPRMAGGAAQLRSFIFAIAKNVLRAEWRRRGRDRKQQPLAEEPLDQCPAPSAVMQSAEESDRIIAAIRRLDEPTRDVFVLRFVERMPLAEISRVVGEPVGAIKSRLHRGRKKLQGILQSVNDLR